MVLGMLDSALATAERRLADTDHHGLNLSHQAVDELTLQTNALRRVDQPELRIRTQRPTVHHKVVDLEIRVSPAPATDGQEFLFWIEVKHGADPHGTQLYDYEEDIRFSAADHRRVMVLAPRLFLSEHTGTGSPETKIPETMPLVAWETVARAARDWSRGRALREDERWLLDEYLTYLTEEGLMDEQVFTAEHAFVLAAEPSAAGAVAQVCEYADEYVQKQWGARGKYKTQGKQPAYGRDYWALYERSRHDGSSSDTWRNCSFEWGFRRDTSREDSRNGWVFYAGATFFDKDTPVKAADNASWLVSRSGEDFEYVQDWYWRLWRFHYPEQLLVATDIEGQAELLGKFIVDSFEKLADNEPPN